MGDMTTPDFDDLLAAFDIPDLDPKDTIESSQGEAPLKATPAPSPATAGKTPAADLAAPPPDEPAVSVIVKNSASPKRGASPSPPHSPGTEGRRFDSGPMLNGFEAGPAVRSPDPAGSPTPDPESWPSGQPKTGRKETEGLPPLYSPAGDPETQAAAPAEERSGAEEKGRDPRRFSRRSPLFPALPALQASGCSRAPSEGGAPKSPEGYSRSFPPDHERQTGANGKSRSSDDEDEEDDYDEAGEEEDEDDDEEEEEEEEEEEKQSDLESEAMEQSSEPEASLPEDPDRARDDRAFSSPLPTSPVSPWPDPDPNSGVTVSPEPKPPAEPLLPPLPSPAGSPTGTSKGSPEAFPSPPCLGRPMARRPDSPPSASSDDDDDDDDSGCSKASSSTSSSRPLKVRIKTIKTSSGDIMRTVTRVPSDPDGGAAAGEEVERMEEGEGEGPATGLLPPGTETPAPAPARGDVVSLQLGNGAIVKGTVLPTSTFQNASTAMLVAASIAQKATGGAPAPSAKPVSKSVHLASLNLVPQTLPAVPAAPAKALAPAPKYAATTTTTTLQLATKAVNGAPSAQKSAPSAAVARSQAPLVEAFHKLLNGKNPLPTYKPNLCPPADSCLALPPSGYRCLECGDSFALEKSLYRHYDRRSMRIDVTCNHCAKRLVFFNRCSLMLHAREHKDKGLVMQCSNLVMKPITLDQMIGQPDVAPVVGATTSSSSSGPPAGTPKAGGKSAAPGPPQAPAPAIPLLPDPALLTSDNFNCTECEQQFTDRLGLAAHFQVGTPSAAAQVCQLCQMLLPTKCSYAAHYRLHKSKSPCTCPECGGACRATHIQGHAKDFCFHFARKVGYKCPQCGVVYGGITSIKSHIQDVHCEAFHKCPICPMAFKSAPSAHSHIYTQHPGISNQQAKVIHKCAMCDTVFTHQPLLSAHFDQHLSKQRVSVFKCPHCPVLFAQKRTMMEHIKTTHSSLKSEDVIQTRIVPPVKPAAKSSPGSTDSSTDESSSSPKAVLTLQRRKEMRLKLKNAGWTCGQCQMWFPEREEYVAHMKKDHGKAMKKFPCRLCERSFCSAPSLRRHVRVNHEGIKRVYNCRHCTEGKRTFSSRLTLEKHLQVIHGINMADHTQDQENLFERISIKVGINVGGW
uniref:zinc finger protein 687-like n=1 Tax=Pristiophorus japonicus TaxID=55135 RepID=UPI00398F8745